MSTPTNKRRGYGRGMPPHLACGRSPGPKPLISLMALMLTGYSVRLTVFQCIHSPPCYLDGGRRRGTSMQRHHAIATCIFGLLFSIASYADTYRCKPPAGPVVISNRPCEGHYVTTGVVEATSPNAVALQRAQSDLERQKRYIEMRERERTPQAHYGSSVTAPAGKTRDSLNQCLMSVAAKRLSPVSEAQSKISCYVGTGMRDECEMSVTATLGLTTNQENSLRQQCKSIS